MSVPSFLPYVAPHFDYMQTVIHVLHLEGFSQLCGLRQLPKRGDFSEQRIIHTRHIWRGSPQYECSDDFSCVFSKQIIHTCHIWRVSPQYVRSDDAHTRHILRFPPYKKLCRFKCPFWAKHNPQVTFDLFLPACVCSDDTSSSFSQQSIVHTSHIWKFSLPVWLLIWRLQ